MVIGPNVTGWSQLMDGNLILAAYTMYDASNVFAGWLVVILFFVYQFMLLMKTRNLTLSWVTGLFFVSLYITSSFIYYRSCAYGFWNSVFNILLSYRTNNNNGKFNGRFI